MAVPKKKVSKSRRNMRRFSTAYKLDPITLVTSPIDQEKTRPHRITRAQLASGRYLEATASYKKKNKTSASPKA
ncbi:MAG: 50S ribosomal protein L32 [Bdellovibrionales bacterium]|nr:50S ribosomal protein L32 [Bdellovibrionales bacterium]